MKKNIPLLVLALIITGPQMLFAQQKKALKTTVVASPKLNTDKPNILVIWGDDIGWQNVSLYGLGTMGYTTPNIDRIGKEGIQFVDHYAQPSCTAGRASFITGQYPIRSGMTTVGSPGDVLGLQPESPSLAEVLKKQGYTTGHFGKNHLGDRNIHLPTAHGFDEFLGNLYHLNTQEESEQRDYQSYAKNYPGGFEAYEKKFGTRNILHSYATDVDDPTVQPRWGKVGKQRIEDMGPLTQKRMETVDGEETIPAAINFMKKAKANSKPFFVWLNTSRMHLYTRLSDKSRYLAEKYTSEVDVHGSGMIEHDEQIKMVLDFLDQNGLAENTIVWYSTDNGPEHNSWPHGGTTPFRGEKMSTFEGGVRVISMLRWPSQIKAGQVLNGMQAHMDMFTTLAAAAGVKDVAADLMAEKKQYIDGINNLDYWEGKTNESKRHLFLYYYESKLMAVRMDQWKIHFSSKETYYSNVVALTVPLIFNIRMDPNESYSSEDAYGHLLQKMSWILAPMGEMIGEHIKTLVMYPPVQGSKSFDMSNMIGESLKKGSQ